MSNVLFKNKEMIIFNKCKNYVNNNYLVQLLRLYYQETTLYIGPVSTTHKSSEKGSFDILINIHINLTKTSTRISLACQLIVNCI